MKLTHPNMHEKKRKGYIKNMKEKQTMMQTNKMGTRPMFPLLMSMSFPPMISMLVQAMYNIVDSIFVAQYNQDALTAVLLAFPIQNFMLSVAVGTGVGVNAYISRKLGEKNQKQADIAASHAIVLAALSAIAFIFLGSVLIEPFFRMFSKSENIIKLGSDYTYIVVFLAFGSLIHIAVEKILQATGKMVLPMILQGVGAIVNIILDPIMIFGWMGFPEMGIRGAAIATVIGQITSMTLSILVLIFIKNDVKVSFKKFKLQGSVIKDIYKVGAPSIVMMSLNSVLVMGLNSILVGFSNMAVSVFGVYYKLQTFVFMPVSGLTQGAMPIMGYNFGAGDKKRLREVQKFSLIVSVAIMAVGNLLFCLFPSQLMLLFDATEDMLSMGRKALAIISLSYIPAAFGLVFATLFQATGKGIHSLVIFLLRQLVITLPLSYLLSNFFGLMGIWVSFPIAELIAAVAAFVMYKKIKY